MVRFWIIAGHRRGHLAGPVLRRLPAGDGVPLMTIATRAARVLVAGAGVAGAACADVLLALGAQVTVLDRVDTPTAERLRAAGRRGRASATSRRRRRCWTDVDDVVVSPGFAPHTPVVRAAVAAGMAGLLRAGAGLAAARPGRPGLAGASPAPTARPPPPRCWPRSCARPGCAPPRWATSASRWCTPRSTPRPVRRAGGRAVQLPAALVVDAGAAGRGAAEPGRRPPGVARHVRRVRRGQAGDLARPAAAGAAIAVGNLDDPLVATMRSAVPGPAGSG